MAMGPGIMPTEGGAVADRQDHVVGLPLFVFALFLSEFILHENVNGILMKHTLIYSLVLTPSKSLSIMVKSVPRI
jgi:hypothetical protein